MNLYAEYEYDEKNQLSLITSIELPLTQTQQNPGGNFTYPMVTQPEYSLTLGYKQYELSNHLGNVQATISDKKLGLLQDETSTFSGYEADLLSSVDYYPFGMQMPGRNLGSDSYRFGFNGKENDPETIGTEQGTQDYGMRIYNPSLGRFLSVDPLAREYPHAAPYAFAENGPIENIDRDGEERMHYTIVGYNSQGVAQLKYQGQEDIKERKFDWKTLSFKTETNARYEYVIHSGVIHEGAVNGNLYTQEITFIYDNEIDFVEKGTKITKSDVEQQESTYKWADRIFAGLENVRDEMRDGFIPGQNRGNAKHSMASRKGIYVPLKANGAPDFSGHLAKVGKGQKNSIKLQYTGSYSKDFSQADKLAGFTKENPRPANTTWHHVEDYNSTTNTGTLVLVPADVHKAATPHSGGAAQYREANGSGYGKKP